MGFTNLNSDDFAFFSHEWTIPEKKALRKKISDLGIAVFDNLPSNIRETMQEPKFGRIYQNSKSMWFSLRPKGTKGAKNINYNFNLWQNEITYCLNSEIKYSVKKIFRKSVLDNKSLFLEMVNRIPETIIWQYERPNLPNRRSNYNYYYDWDLIKKYEGFFDSSTLNELLAKIDTLPYSAVRIGRVFSKDGSTAISHGLPNKLIQITKDYFGMYKFLNNL